MHDTTPAVTSTEYRFFADAMLGSLARWLRILGYDTEYVRDVDDDELVRRCREQERIALTKDRRLASRKQLARVLLIGGESLGVQLREVLALTGDDPQAASLHSRCVECNGVLDPAPRADVRDHVPPYVFRTQERFRRCRRCGRIYWAGTHRERMLGRLSRLLSEVP